MKVAIMTFVRAYNYGAVLQAYALNKAINDIGVECQTIDYYPKAFRNSYSLRNHCVLRLKPAKNPKWWVLNNLLCLRVKKRNKKFSGFLKKHFRMTKKQFCNANELETCLNFDVYISGSDQVWNPEICGFDKAFFLTFCKDKKKISYAASFGINEIPKEYKQEFIKRLSGWNAYSVREPSGVEIINDLVGERAECHCDPTFLLSSQDWVSSLSIKKRKEEYILVYIVDESDALLNYAYQLSEQLGLKVYCLHSTMKPEYFRNKIDEYHITIVYAASPKEYLSYFLSANYILTNSFHGTVFSVIFHKKFLCESVSNGRAGYLLQKLSLQNRVLNDSRIEKIFEEINWDSVENRIKQLRDGGLSYLKSQIIE